MAVLTVWAFLLLACDGLFAPEPVGGSSDGTIAALEVEGPFWYQPALTTETPPPSLFDGPARELLADSRYLILADQICLGRSGRREALLEILASELPEPLERRLAEMLARCGDPGFTSWLVGHTGGPGGHRLLEILAEGGDPAHAAVFTESSVAPSLVARWMRDHPVWDERLGPALREAVATGGEYAHYLSVLERVVSPDSASALYAAYEAAPTPKVRAAVGRAMGNQLDRRSRRLYRKHCDRSCTPAPMVAGPLAALFETVRDPEVDLRGLLERYPDHQQAIISALERCAIEERRAVCIERLAALNWGRAQAAVGGAASDEKGGRWVTLRRFSSGEELGDHLRALGLITGASRGATAAHQMRAAGSAVEVNPWTEETSLDGLARCLAARVPELAGAEFLEVGALSGIASDRTVLQAWHRGRRWHITAWNRVGERDVERVVGLLNTMLRDLESRERVILLETNTPQRTVVMGPESGLLQALEEDLLHSSEPSPMRRRDATWEF